MGVGHRMTMIAMLPSILACLRDQDHLCLDNLLIASSRDYDLILVCFAKILRMRNMVIFVLGNQVEKP